MKILKEKVHKLDKNQVDQVGLRKGYSTIDYIHNLGQIIENSRKYKNKINLMFIDSVKRLTQ